MVKHVSLSLISAERDLVSLQSTCNTNCVQRRAVTQIRSIIYLHCECSRASVWVTMLMISFLPPIMYHHTKLHTKSWTKCDISAHIGSARYRFVRIWHQAWRYQWMHSLLRWDTSPFICSSLSLDRSSEFRPFSRSCRASSACFSLFSSSTRDSISAWDTQEKTSGRRCQLI